MKNVKRLMMVLLATMMMSTAAWAEMDSKDHHEGDKQWSDFRMMMTERHQMMRGMMKMTRDTMEIVKNLNHKPSGAEKEKLAKMIEELDGMIAKDEEVSKKMMKKWKKDDHHM